MPLIPLPKTYHPELGSQLVKPTGRMVIDYDNPLTKDVEHLLLLDRGMEDLAQARAYDYTTVENWQGTARGLAYSSTGPNGGSLSVFGLHNESPNELTNGNFSLTFITKVRSVSTRGAIYGFGSNAGSNGIYLWYESTGEVMLCHDFSLVF
jgi:hypothetical protein